MSTSRLVCAAAVLVALAACAAAPESVSPMPQAPAVGGGMSGSSPAPTPSESRLRGICANLDTAVAGAVRAVEQRKEPVNLSSYSLIAAQRMLGQRSVWLVTFKPTNLIEFDNPTLGGPTAAGAEMYVKIDIETGESSIRFGE